MGKGGLSEVQKTAPLDGQKLPASNTDTEYKEHSKTERVESTRRRYGEFQNVFLSDEECSQLETAYLGKAAEYIERLSRYMACLLYTSLLFFIGQLTSLLIVIYDYPAAHEPGGHIKENEQQNCSCCPNRHCFLSGVDFIAPCK